MADAPAKRWELAITDTAKFSFEGRQCIINKLHFEIYEREYLFEKAKRYATPEAILIMENAIRPKQQQPPEQASNGDTSSIAQNGESSSQPIPDSSQLQQSILETGDSSSSSSVVIAHGSSIRAPLGEREVFINPALLPSSIEEDEALFHEEEENNALEHAENLPMSERNGHSANGTLLVDPELFAVHEDETTEDEFRGGTSHFEDLEPQSTDEAWENEESSQLDRDGDIIMSISMEKAPESMPDVAASEAATSSASTASMEYTLSSEPSETLVDPLPENPPPVREATVSNLNNKIDHLPDSIMLPRSTRFSFKLDDYIRQIELTRVILAAEAQRTNASTSSNTNCQVESSATVLDSSDDSDSDEGENWVPSLVGPGGRYELYTEKPVRGSDLIALHHEIAELRDFLRITEDQYCRAKTSRVDGLTRGKRILICGRHTQRLLSGGMSSRLREVVSADEKWPEGEWGMPPPKPPRSYLDLRHIFAANGVTDYKIGDGYAPKEAARPTRPVR